MMEMKTDHFLRVTLMKLMKRVTKKQSNHCYPFLIPKAVTLSFFPTIILMRTPSLYSQDDPITAAMKPPSSETESERNVRLVAEAEAKRISERIDEDLREERERLKKKKGDVKVRLSLYPYRAAQIHLHYF